MLSYEDIKDFFVRKNISLKEDRPLAQSRVFNIFEDAGKISNSFSSFILYTVINSDRNGIQTNFESWDDLYTCYCAWMTGYSGNKC